MDDIAARYLPFLRTDDCQLLAHILHRTDATLSGLVEQFIGVQQVIARIRLLDDAKRDAAVDDLVTLVRAVDVMLLHQAEADAEQFSQCCNGAYAFNDHSTVLAVMMGVYRWRYIVAGMHSPRFMEQLSPVLTTAQLRRVVAVLEPMMASRMPSTISAPITPVRSFDQGRHFTA